MSRARFDLGVADHDDILRSSIKNNAASGITGLLLCDGFRFLQAIEGDDDEIDRCFARICVDPRHYDVVLTENGQIDRCEFGDWSLISRHRFDIDPPPFRSLVNGDVRDVSDIKLKALFVGFASLAR